MNETTQLGQTTIQIAGPANKTQALGPGAVYIYPPWGTRGQSQLRGTAVHSAGGGIGVLEIYTSPDPATIGWYLIRTYNLILGTPVPFVEDIVDENVRIVVRETGVINPITVVTSANLYPDSSIESTGGALHVDVVTLDPRTTVHHNAANNIGNGTDANLDYCFSMAKVHITSTVGIIAATIQFWGSTDGVNFVQLEAMNVATYAIANNAVIGAAANEIWEINVGGLRYLRCVLSAINPAGGVPTVTVTSKAIQGAMNNILLAWNQNERAKTSPIVGQDGVQATSGATTANTQRVVVATDNPTYAAPNAAVPARAELIGLHYQAVPVAGADGDLMSAQGTAFGRLETAEFNRATGAAQVIEQAPVEYDIQVGIVRASAALAGAGAYDVPVEIPTGRRRWLRLGYDYTRGALNGAVQMIIQACETIGGIDRWADALMVAPGALVAGNDTPVQMQRSRTWRYDSTAAAMESGFAIFDLGRAAKFRIYSAEIGVTGTPGTFASYYTLFN